MRTIKELEEEMITRKEYYYLMALKDILELIGEIRITEQVVPNTNEDRLLKQIEARIEG